VAVHGDDPFSVPSGSGGFFAVSCIRWIGYLLGAAAFVIARRTPEGEADAMKTIRFIWKGRRVYKVISPRRLKI